MKHKQIISLLLTLLMLFSSLPIPAYAEWYDEETGNEDYSGTVVSASDAIVIPDWDDFSGDDASDLENENAWEEWDEYADFSGEESDETEDDPFWFDEEQPDEWETWEEPENEESPDDSPVLSLKETIDLYGYAYVLTKGETKVYDHPNRAGEPFFLLTEEDAILLATEYRGQGTESIKVWFIGDELFNGYVSPSSLKDEVLTDEEVDAYTGLYWWDWAETEAGTQYAFAVAGYATITSENDVWDNEWETEINADDESDSADADLAHDPDQSEADEYDELTEDEAVQEENEPDDPEVTVGSFLFVTTKTRAFSDMDDTWRDNANGDFYMGVFVKDAVVQVDAVKVDSTGRMWYQVAFLYGDDFADGTMKWTEIGFAYVLPEETVLTDAEDLTVTDIALPETPKVSGRRMLMKAAGTTPMNGFTLKSINAPIPPLYAGQTGVYGSSGHDSDYKQIASLAGKGAIYATPHYLDGYTVYCLEHNLPGPGEGSGSSQQPKGPYVIVDIDTYMNTPGSSRVIYSDQTMHAIAWVLRHTYPFMVLDRSDSDNETWSRVAGQFAIRQVIREMEGAQYVRDYWNMDNFYVASGQAPAVYLEYARWLAANGIARGNITGYISIADKSIAKIGEYYVGTVTLYTDADLLRIPRSGATITGNTLGSDSSYYYLNNGDTIQITSSVNGFSITVESVNSDENEASFLVGVPSAAIQKVLIPTHGTPYKLQSTTLFFELEIKYGRLIVTKLREGSQQTLAGATFQLYDSGKSAYGDPVTTDANGQAKWENLPYGTYYVGEVGAPIGYQVNVNQVLVTINGDNTATFEDSPIIGSVSFVKFQQGTEIPLVGAQYELVTKSGSTYTRAVSAVDGSELPVLTTDANGKATWSNVLEYGTYYVHEVQAPEGFLLDNTYHAVNVTHHNKIVSADVEDPIITAKIKIAKTDGLTKEPLAGVEFTVTRLSGPAALNGGGVGEVAAVITTDANGYAETDWLAWGRYKIEETKAPTGYTNIHYSTEIEAYENGKTYTINVENVPSAGYIRLTKTDANSRAPLKGVQFDIYQGDKLISTMTTDVNGVALSGPLTKGTYIVREHGNPEGYTGELVTLPATVFSDQTTELAAENKPIQFTVKIIKKDSMTHEPLAGAEFTITRKESGVVVATLTTDINGEATSGLLRYGEYEIKETKVPANYIDSGFTITVNGTEHGKTYVIEADNQPMQGGIRITKTDKLDGSPIAGVVFDIYQDGTKVGSMTTNASGVAVSGELPKGNYTVKERGLPEGYTGALVSLDCVVKSNEVTDLKAENQPIQVKIKVIKTDALTHEPLAGAQFTVTRKDTGAVAATLTTDNKGEAESGLLRYGEYEIKETKVPANYIDSSFTTAVNGTENGKTYVIEAENQPMQGGIRVIKTDKLDGAPIAGVVFDIYQDGTKVGSMTTDASGVAVSGELPKGNYTVKEHGLPEGYTGDLVSLDCVVKSNEVTELKAENLPIQFKVKIVKTDALTKEPLAGAEFSIIRTDNGETVEVLTTNSKGEAGSGLLRYGKYEVKETKIPTNYMDNPFSVTVNGTEDGKTYEIQAENQPMAGGIRITKTDKLDGSPIAGVVFDIYQGSTKIGSMTTNASGVAVSGELPKGNYTVKEHGLPEAYTGALVSLDCVVKPNVVSDLKAENQPIQFKVKIVKTDGLTQEPVSGAEFTITRKDTVEPVATLTTDKNGIAISDLLRYGEYTVTETKTPAHYAESTFFATVNGTENAKVYEIRVENEPTKGQIRLLKTDALDGTPIIGVIFDIYDGDKLVGSMKTDENGVAMSDPLPKGNYTVKEHENPEGYVADLVSLECSVKSDEVTKLKAENMPIRFRIRILKTDALTQEPLSGAEFTITRKAGLPSHNGEGNGEVVTKLITDDNGEAISDLLTWGEYEITETKVPEYYVDNHYAMTVTGSENEKVYEIHVENEPTKGWIRLVKTDRLDGHPIAGVVFDILQDGKIITTMTTNTDGVAVSEHIPKGKYTVKEHVNPEGYTNELFSVDCEVFSDVVTRMNADNQPIRGRIQITKKDELTKSLLAGAEFTITRVSGLPSHNGEGNGEVVAVLTTDNSGAAVSPLLTWGTYKVEETKVPEQYVDNHFFAMVVIKDNEKTYEITAENEPTKGWIELIKTDALDRTPIAGVQFDIYENDEFGSGLAGSMITDENGVAKSPALRKGKYLVKEHENPTGYLSDLATVECTVKSDEITHTNATNQPIQGKIRIIKTDELTKEALAGAEFTVTRVSGLPSHNGSNDGEVVAVITTDADGIAVTPLLTWGTYKVEETSVPVHYVDNGYSTEVTIQEENLITIDVPVENEPAKGWIRLTKTDRKNGNPISGVQFDIYYNDQYGEGLAATMTTGEDGVALPEPLRKGKYIVKEHGQTPGYLFEEITLECTVKSDEITDLTATNQPIMTRLMIYKRDRNEYKKDLNATPGTRGDGVLTGTVYTVRAGEDITDRQGNILYEKGVAVQENLKTSGEEASVLTDELWPGVYEIVEVTPPTGYQLDETPVRVDTTAAAQQSTETVMTYTGVNTNEVLYGRYAFVKFYGDNLVHSDAGLIEKPEVDAVFRVYLKSAGSYEAARKFERDTITTDKNGKAQTKLLPYGIYTVEQIKGKKGYAIKAPFDIFIRGTEDPSDPPTMIINNEAIHYRLKFIKVDAETGNTITAAHTSFKLKDSEGNYVTQTVYYPNKTEIDTFTTDETGEVTLPETLIYGLYFAEEFEAPEGYLIATQEIPVFVGDDHFDQPGEAYLLEYMVENEPVKGRILLEKKGLRLTGFEEKTDGFGNTYSHPVYEEKYLTGAVFEIHAAEDIIGKDGTLWYHADELVDTITTTAEGKDASKVLPLGKYYLVETAAPEGYIFTDERYEANLEYADDHTALVEITVEAHNDYLPVSVSLEKEMEIMEIIQGADNTVRQTVSTVPGKGFVFGLYNDKDIHYDGGTLLADMLVATGVTDEDGKLTFSGVYPHGSYYIKELSTLDGWKLNPNTFSVDLTTDKRTSDNVIRVSLSEPVKNSLIYTHVTLTKTDITGQQTVLGALIEVTDSDGNVIYRGYTDETGEIPDIPVTPGRYTFREILAPEGYELNKAEMSFSVDKDGNVTGDTVIRDDYTRFYLLKLDESGRPMPGVEFSLVNGAGNVLLAAVSDEKGLVTFEKIPYGTYSIVETNPLPGYIPDKTSVQITLEGTFVNPTLPLATIVNRPNTVWLKKVDQDGQPLAGAEFVLCSEYGERVQTAVSDRNGVVRFNRIPYGNYSIREIIAPNGYLLSRDVIPLTVDKDFVNSEEPIATITNHLKRLKYIKVDTNGKYLPGVEFTLINAATGEEVETVVSNEKGEFIFTQFDYGVWIIRETKAPDGYNLMEDLTVSVDSDWVEPEPFTCVNIPNYFMFVKTDSEGNPLTGVKFTLEDNEGNVLRDLISADGGVVFIPGLTPGTYLIREVETLEGYTVSSEPIQVVIDEHYAIPNEMPTFINYPTIQTGAGVEMTPIMWAGAGFAGAALLLGTGLIIKRKKKTHKK